MTHSWREQAQAEGSLGLSGENPSFFSFLEKYGAYGAYVPFPTVFRVPLQVYVEGLFAEICDIHTQGFQAVYGSVRPAASRAPCLRGARLAEETGPRACYQATLLPEVQQ